jgi:hypothetical protein
MEQPRRKTPPAAFEPSFSSRTRLRAAPSAHGGGEAGLRFALMREVLLRYLSPVLLDSVLTRALQVRRLSPASLDEQQLAEIAADIMVGLRLFVDEDRLSQLMLDLAELVDPPP